MTHIHRRTWLSAAAAGMAAGLGPARSDGQAGAQSKKQLVLVLASGGWDPTYVFDPKPGSQLVDAPSGQVQELAGIPLLTHPERPSVTRFFEQYGSLSVVVNGLSVRSFVHSDCMKRILTGTASDQAADFAALAAHELGRDRPVPYFVLGTSAMSGPLSDITARAGTTSQMASLLRADNAPDLLLPRPAYQPTEAERTGTSQYLERRTARLLQARGERGEAAQALGAFRTSLERKRLLEAFARTSTGFGERQYTPDLGVQVNVALDAIASDLSQAVMLESSDWDTHQNNAQQSTKFEALFEGLHALVSGLEQRQLLERVVVVVLSEMGRTPRLNEAQGKDHWPVTSALVLGGGVKGGRVIGGTTDSQGSLPLNLQTGAPQGSGKQLQTGNLLAGLLSLVGAQPEPHFPGVEPLSALYA
jgi:uncharacterized protein (DUF1501 family)